MVDIWGKNQEHHKFYNMDADIKQLQHISDIRGIAIGSTPNVKIVLSDEIIKKVAISYAQWLSDKTGKPMPKLKIAVGMDSRLSGPDLKNSSIETLQKAGVHVLDCQMASTAAMYLTLTENTYKCDGIMMITASHLPFNWNGVKLIVPEGILNKEDIQNILSNGKSPNNQDIKKGKLEEIDILTDYSNKIKKYIIDKSSEKGSSNKPLKGLKIIVDAGNGVAGFFVKKILEPLGADTTGSIFLQPDGNFPNHHPNTEDDNAIKALQKAIIDNDGDLGIIFDSDMDKVAFVDYRGNPIKGDKLVALVAALVIEETPKATIVTDSITSEILTDFIQNKLGGIHHRFKRGYKRVINEANRLNSDNLRCPVAIETSGHSAFSENNFIDDGAFLAAKVLIRLAKFRAEGKHDICELIKDYNNQGEQVQFRLQIKSPDHHFEGNRIIQTVKRFSDTVPGWKIVLNNFDGVRVTAEKFFGDGWYILRMSLHEAYLVLNVESTTKRGVQMTLNRLMKIFSRIQSIDSKPIDDYLKNL